MFSELNITSIITLAPCSLLEILFSAYFKKELMKNSFFSFVPFITEALLGGGGGAHVPCLNFTSSYVDIPQGLMSPVGISSKRNCDIGVAFPISLE